MTSRLDRVRQLFDNTRVYLRNDAHIAIRQRAVRDLLGTVTGTLLDAGCGDARCSLQLLDGVSRLTLADLSPNMLALAARRIPAKDRQRVTLVESSLESLPGTGTAPFDTVLCLGVLAHVPDVRAAIATLARLTGDRLVVQLTDHQQPVSALNTAIYRVKKRLLDRAGYEINRPTVAEVVGWAREQGLELVATRQYWVMLPFLGRMPPRWTERVLHRLYDSPRASRWGVEKCLLFRK